MTHITRMLIAKNRDQLWNPAIGNRIWATSLPFYIETRSSPNVCACACGSVLLRRRGITPPPLGVHCLVVYVGYFRFMDDIMFASNAPSYTVTRKERVFKTVPWVATLGAKSAIFDCLVCCRLVCVNPQHIQMCVS